jgi:hypothetical protein
MCGKKIVPGAPLLLSLSPHGGHPTEGYRVFYKRCRDGDVNVKHEEFAARAERRLEAAADRGSGKGRRLGTGAEVRAVGSAEQDSRVGPIAANPP